MIGVQIALICMVLVSSSVLCEETLAEWQVTFKQNFKDMDSDHDNKATFSEYEEFFLHGKLQQTLQEYLQVMPDLDDSERQILTDDFRFFDIDGDDILSVSDLQHNFNTIDHNHDGYIEEPEFVAYASRMYTEKQHPAFGK
ncbi:uncharacterized protein LOC121383012 [Gigantopelta aegis]|uniref:uncharacterized protein LOC121383012 n=1 Tax=Gigantopelta aegis TaxID=1735272 RepID=UPI001B889A1C|nr:uncharacterized protein LOC121383012 [Gigantopelta aegis]